MNLIQHFDSSRGSVWMYLLVAVLLLSGPFYTSQASSVSGEITAIDVIGRVIEVDGARYTLAQQAEIHSSSGETMGSMSIADLKVGQYVEFEASGNVISSLRVFEGGPPT